MYGNPVLWRARKSVEAAERHLIRADMASEGYQCIDPGGEILVAKIVKDAWAKQKETIDDPCHKEKLLQAETAWEISQKAWEKVAEVRRN